MSELEQFTPPVNRGWSAGAVRTVPAVSAADDRVAFAHLEHDVAPVVVPGEETKEGDTATATAGNGEENESGSGSGSDSGGVKPTRDQFWVYGGVSGVEGKRYPLQDLWCCDFVVV